MGFAPPFPGIHSIVFALFDAHERLDRAAMRKQTRISLDLDMQGMAALGLATEVSKLSFTERCTVMEWLAEDVAGKKPLAFTIFGSSVAEQAALVKVAEQNGADWVILQPPMVGSFGAADLSAEDIRELTRRYPNISLIKGEGSVVEIERLIAVTEGHLPILNGRGGLELIDNFRAGCAGMILAPDTIDYALRAYNRYKAGDEAGADAAYREVLPAITFIMQSIETLLCYGKRIFGARAGIAIHDRGPALRPTEFGLRLVERYARELGPYSK